jgi:hypothetical protein
MIQITPNVYINFDTRPTYIRQKLRSVFNLIRRKNIMAINIIGDFFSLINVSLFDSMTVILITSFIIWEFPRSINILSEEYRTGLYPEKGRVVDIFLFFIGLCSIAYFIFNADKIVSFLKTPGITSFFLILMLTIPLIIVIGYIKRFFARMDGHNSITVFLTHGFLDLMHTLFYLSLVILFIPVIGHLLFGVK